MKNWFFKLSLLVFPQNSKNYSISQSNIIWASFEVLDHTSHANIWWDIHITISTFTSVHPCVCQASVCFFHFNVSLNSLLQVPYQTATTAKPGCLLPFLKKFLKKFFRTFFWKVIIVIGFQSRSRRKVLQAFFGTVTMILILFASHRQKCFTQLLENGCCF